MRRALDPARCVGVEGRAVAPDQRGSNLVRQRYGLRSPGAEQPGPPSEGAQKQAFAGRNVVDVQPGAADGLL